MKKKIIALVLACLLLFSAAYAQSGAADLVDSFCGLAFATDNVTVNATAEFSLDGEWFKTMHAVYKQCGFNSYLEYMLDTPRADGTVYTGGYTVIGIDDMAYSNDTYFGNRYSSITNYPSNTILNDTDANRLIALALRSCAASAEGLMDEFTAEPCGDGMKYTIKCADLPGIVDSALYYLVADYLSDNYYVELSSNVYAPGVVALYEDYDALVAAAYRTIFGEDMPASFDDETLSGRYSVASGVVFQNESEETAKYTDGYIWFAADGTTTYYGTEDELRRAVGTVRITYDDYQSALLSCYEALYGEKLTEDELSALYMTGNTELSDKFYAFMDELDTYYSDAAKALEPNAVACKVLYDGTIKVYDHMPLDLYTTPAKALMYTTAFASLKNVDVTVILDNEGRAAEVSGSLEIEVLDSEKHAYTVGVKFTGKCSDYDTTYVKDYFDAADYGWISYDEYIEQLEAADDELYDEEEYGSEPLPEKITFMGTEYDVMLSDD